MKVLMTIIFLGLSGPGEKVDTRIHLEVPSQDVCLNLLHSFKLQLGPGVKYRAKCVTIPEGVKV